MEYLFRWSEERFQVVRSENFWILMILRFLCGFCRKRLAPPRVV